MIIQEIESQLEVVDNNSKRSLHLQLSSAMVVFTSKFGLIRAVSGRYLLGLCFVGCKFNAILEKDAVPGEVKAF